MGDVVGQRSSKMPFTDRNEAVETFLFESAHESPRMRIAVRRTVRNPDHSDARHHEESNGGTPLSIAIADQDTIRTEDSVDIDEIAQGWGDERLVWMRCGAQDDNTTRVEFDHRRRVVGDQSARRPGLSSEEIRSDKPANARAKMSATSSAARFSVESPLLADLANRGSRDAMVQVARVIIEMRPSN
jgi:hypothetical protein